jgi:hypothetical protein
MQLSVTCSRPLGNIPSQRHESKEKVVPTHPRTIQELHENLGSDRGQLACRLPVLVRKTPVIQERCRSFLQGTNITICQLTISLNTLFKETLHLICDLAACFREAILLGFDRVAPGLWVLGNGGVAPDLRETVGQNVLQTLLDLVGRTRRNRMPTSEVLPQRRRLVHVEDAADSFPTVGEGRSTSGKLKIVDVHGKHKSESPQDVTAFPLRDLLESDLL